MKMILKKAAAALKVILSDEFHPDTFRKGPFSRLENLRAYMRFRKLIPELAGYKFYTLFFLEEKAAELGYSDLESYRRFLEKNPESLEDMKKNLTYKGTHFFRGEEWDPFIKECLSTFRGRRDVRVWCAGCSSGQEVYSVIMALMDYVELEDISVLATDYNDELLDKCRKGVYGSNYFPEIPERYRKHLKESHKVEIKEELKAVVETENLNLLTDEYPNGFDVILCRNVMKFFDRQIIPKVQEKLCSSLEAGGYLFVSTEDGMKTIEMLDRPEDFGMEQIGDTCIYRKKRLREKD